MDTFSLFIFILITYVLGYISTISFCAFYICVFLVILNSFPFYLEFTDILTPFFSFGF